MLLCDGGCGAFALWLCRFVVVADPWTRPFFLAFTRRLGAFPCGMVALLLCSKLRVQKPQVQVVIVFVSSSFDCCYEWSCHNNDKRISKSSSWGNFFSPGTTSGDRPGVAISGTIIESTISTQLLILLKWTLALARKTNSISVDSLTA
jgi:hypothetical protein